MRKVIYIQFILGLSLIVLFNLFCGNVASDEETSIYLNHSDTVKYIGKEACKTCHAGIYESFMQTGMGKSFGPALHSKSSADFSGNKILYDSIKKFYYYPHWNGDSLYLTEFRLNNKDTIYKRTERVDYIIGSGQHTNSHFTNINGYIYQLPFTWYAQKKHLDFPPGFENGRNIRFSRAIEFECMSCHNAMPALEEGSVNKYTNIPTGIDCERCHGPGERHVWQIQNGIITDTSNQIDYSIVNPRKLSWERQIDVCQRCHLQGNAILKEGKKFSDFKPGMKLSNVMDVYLPKYNGKENEFIMASHAQRLQQSKCFIVSNKQGKQQSNKAFASMNLTCINCHNPHVSVTLTGKQVFNNACIKCHGTNACKEEPEKLNQASNNCVSCHMPKSGSVDIPHVSVHDHKIRIPVSNKSISDIKRFAGIYCVNNEYPDAKSKAQAYLNYYEKFEGESLSLDSSLFYLNRININEIDRSLKIHYFYLKNDWLQIIEAAKEIDLNKQNDPWVCYRIGQAYQNSGDFADAKSAYERALFLAPLNLEFNNKLAVVLIQQQQFENAVMLLRKNLFRQPKQEDAWVNLGFALLNLNHKNEAMSAYETALKLDPDHNQALLNRAALYHLVRKKKEAIIDLKHILSVNPGQKEVVELLKQLQLE